MGLQNANGDWVDDITDSLLTTDHAHHEIHTGNHWFSNVVDKALANGGKINLVFSVDETTDLTHMIMYARSLGTCEIEFYENPTVGGDGTPVEVQNRRRDMHGVITGAITATTGHTSITGGTWLDTSWVGSNGVAGSTGAGNDRASLEILLKPGFKYAIILENISGSSARALVGGDYYKHNTDWHNKIQGK